MKKLISKQPILRFKLGRKILKGLYGLKPHEILGAGVNGLKVAYVNIPGKGYIAVDANGNAYRIKGEDKRGKIYLHDFQFVPIKLTNYDRYHVYKAATRQGGMTGYNNILSIANYWGREKVANPNAVVTKNKPVARTGGTGGSGGAGRTVARTGGTSFKSAFDTARNAGQLFFTWNNQKYTTQNKGEENYLFQNGKWVDPKSVITFTPPEEAMAQIGNSVLLNNETAAQPTVPNYNDVQPIHSDEQIAELKNLMTPEDNSYIYTPKQYEPSYTPRQYKPIYTYVPYTEQLLKNAFTPQTFTLFSKKGGSLTSRNPVKRFKSGGILFAQNGLSFKEAWNEARRKKQRYFNWTDKLGNTKMYNSQAAGNDTDYLSFTDNMAEMSALLKTDNSPKHLGWERNNPVSNELRGNDRELKRYGTESMLPEVVVIGHRKQKPTINSLPKKVQSNLLIVYNVPMGAIEYTGRDGKQYWMTQNHSNGQYVYVERNKPISYAKQVVPEGYIIPGTNIRITKGTNIGKIALNLKKKWI